MTIKQVKRWLMEDILTGMDEPKNIDKIAKFCLIDMLESGGNSTEDLRIAFRRYLEKY